MAGVSERGDLETSVFAVQHVRTCVCVRESVFDMIYGGGSQSKSE